MKRLISVLILAGTLTGCNYKLVKSYTQESEQYPGVFVQTIVMPKEYNDKENVYVNQTDTNRIHVSRVLE